MTLPQHAWVSQVLSGPTPEQIRGWTTARAREQVASLTAHRDRHTLIAAENVQAAARYQRQIDAIHAIHPKENKT